MKRCAYCRGRIWPFPWVRIGWYVSPYGGDTVYWHPKCHRRAVVDLRDIR